jgi:hypothetical protein
MIVYLDIDGVLIPDRASGSAINPVFASRLRRILDATGAKLVISSHRRRSLAVVDLLGCAGFSQADLALVWFTPLTLADPDDDLSLRGQEIAAHVSSVAAREFVILDDCPVLASQAQRHVQTDPDVGLTDADVDQAIAILQGRHSQSQMAA